MLDRPLADLIVAIKAADVERKKLTGGRIGVRESVGAQANSGSDGDRQRAGSTTTLPMLVTDANKLQEYYVAAGAVYEGEGKTTVLPPPPPDDFVPPSTTVVSDD